MPETFPPRAVASPTPLPSSIIDHSFPNAPSNLDLVPRLVPTDKLHIADEQGLNSSFDGADKQRTKKSASAQHGRCGGIQHVAVQLKY